MPDYCEVRNCYSTKPCFQHPERNAPQTAVGRLEAKYKNLSRDEITDKVAFRTFYLNAYSDLTGPYYTVSREDAIEAWNILLSGPYRYEHLDLFFTYLHSENCDCITKSEWSAFWELADTAQSDFSKYHAGAAMGSYRLDNFVVFAKRQLSLHQPSSLSSSSAVSASKSPCNSSANSLLTFFSAPFSPSALTLTTTTTTPSSTNPFSPHYLPSSSPAPVGLSNQGATCYMNSLLQSLFMTPVFRNALYRWIYSKERDGGEAQCIPYQLQLLFARLQSSTNFSIDTTQLTHSFGWSSAESFRQHDVQELCRVLFDAFERTLPPEQYRTLVTDNYQGVCQDVITCDPGKHASKREDNFLDISLMVKDCDSLEAAFAKFTEPEMLDGANAYRCDKCGEKVNAQKRTAFCKFPPLLTIVLKRFDLDRESLRRVKLNHCVRFPFTLDVTPYLFETPATPPLYDLYSVLVHSGNAVGGHYFAYIKSGDNWLKFNDSMVTPASTADVEVCHGGGDSTTNAYMLLYRKFEEKTEGKELPSYDEVPPELKARLQQLETREHNTNVQDSKENFSVDVVFRHAPNKRRSGSNKLLCGNAQSSVSIRLERDSTFQDLKNRVLETLDPTEVENLQWKGEVDPARVRIRKWMEFAKVPDEDFDARLANQVWNNQSAFMGRYYYYLEVLQHRALVFQPFRSTESTINVHVLEKDALEYSPPVEVRTATHGTIEEFKLAIQMVLGYPADRQYLCFPGLENQMEPLVHSAYFSFFDKNQIYMELLEEGEDSRIQQKHAGDRNKVKLMFNIPGPRIRHWSNVSPIYDQSLLVDRLCSVGELKVIICSKLAIDPIDIAICSGSRYFYSEPPEISEAHTVSYFYAENTVFVRRTVPMKQGEKLITFYLHQTGGEELTELLELGIDPERLVGEVADTISEQLKLRANIDLPSKELRIRAVSFDKATSVLSRKKKLIDYTMHMYECPLKLAIQRADPDVPEDSFMCLVKRWYSSTWTFSAPIEVFIAKGACCGELALIVASAVGIEEPSAVMAVKPYYKADPGTMKSLSWEKLTAISQNLVEHNPFYLANDQLLYVRNADEPVKELTAAQTRALDNNSSQAMDIFPLALESFVDVPRSGGNSKDEGLKIRVHTDLSKSRDA